MKMSRIITSLLALFLVSFSLTTIAAPDLTSLRTNKQNASQSKQMRSSSYAKTDVHVVNNSSQIVTVKVPGTPINDMLYPGEVENIISDVYFDAVEVVLYDEDGYEFFRDYVANHTTVEVRNMFSTRSADSAGKKAKIQAVIQK